MYNESAKIGRTDQTYHLLLTCIRSMGQLKGRFKGAWPTNSLQNRRQPERSLTTIVRRLIFYQTIVRHLIFYQKLVV